MKSKILMLFAATVVLAASAVAQIGGNDWTLYGGPYTQTLADGTTWAYSTYYSPSHTTRNGYMVTITAETVTAGSPPNFYQFNVNCQTSEYTFAKYDTSTNPPTLSTASEWKTALAHSAGTDMLSTFCR